MAEATTPRASRFCWFELGTTDQEAAKKFYGALFGWTVNDFPLGPGMSYSMFQLGGRDVGAAYTLMPHQVQQGVPPHWGTYVSVASVDETVAKAKSLGAKVLAEPMDVFDKGRLAVLQDPTGAVISLWQAKDHKGAVAHGEVGAFCWSELSTRDGAAATRFYTELFNWTTKVTNNTGFPYTHWQTDGQDIGGMIQMNEQWGDMPPHWMNYISVANCDEAAAKAASLGGKVCVPPMDIPGTGRFAVIQDPQGAGFSIIALAAMDKG